VNKNISKSGGACFGAYFSPVLNEANQPIRGLSRRRDLFYARLNLPDLHGRKVQRRITLKAKTVVQAQAELEALRSQSLLPQKQMISPYWADYWPIYISEIKPLKRFRTVNSEKLHCRHWDSFIGKVRLHKIAKSDLIRFRVAKINSGWSARTANLSVTVLSNVLHHAQDSGLIDQVVSEGIKAIRYKPSRRSLYSKAQIDAVCNAAKAHTRNGQLLSNYIQLMASCGSRATETLRLLWSDVDWKQRQLIIGSDGLSKNHESRVVDFNASLSALLNVMRERKSSSMHLFPSPRVTDQDAPARSLKESLRKARALAGVPGFGFHDCRHYFISHAVMSGIDYMTIARWVGHRDGGVLIGKIYGHLNDEHSKKQANRLKFI
jgi:integrase